jgi:hypothetical protein
MDKWVSKQNIMKKKNLFLTAVATLCLTVVTWAQVPAYVPSNGLVGWWPFNGNANDESGNGNDGIMNNGASFTFDRFGNSNSAANLDGIDNYITLPSGSATALNITGDLSVSFWIKTTDNSGLLISSGDNVTSPPSAGGYLSGINGGNVGNGKFSVATRGNWNGSINTINDNIWHNITYVLKNDTMRIYIDNVLDNQLTGIQTPLVWSGSRVIGCRHDLFMTNATNYTGAFDNLLIYNRALNQNEINNVFNENNNSCLIAKYNFNGNANDVSGNNLNGIVNGATLSTDRNGNLNAAYYFDGVDDYIEVADDPLLDFSTNQISVSFWTKVEAYSQANSSYHKVVLSNQSGSGTSQSGFNAKLSSTNGDLSLKNGSGGNFGGASLTPTYALPTNTWKHVVYTWDGTTGKAYVDGLLISESLSTNAAIGMNNLSLLIGKPNWSNINSEHFKGWIDDLHIFSCAIDQIGVDSLYNMANECQNFAITLSSLSNTSFCQGDSAILETQNDATYTYNWYRNGNLQTGTDNTLTATQGGAFYVEVSNGSCTAISNTIDLIRNPLPIVSAGTYSSVCADAPNISLMGTPNGGVFSGTGVTNNEFDPTVGTQNITYSYTDNNNCSNQAEAIITIFELPNVSLTGVPNNTTTCDNGYALVMTPTGGNLVGNGIINGVFYPNIIGEGNTILSYNIVDGNSCGNTTTLQTTISANFSDTTFITETIFDTTFVTETIFDTTFVTETIFDTTFVTVTIFDTTFVTETIYDTITTQVFDTITTQVFDTTYVTQTIYDTLYVTETIYDTTYVTVNDTNYTYISVTDTLVINTTLGLAPNQQQNTIKVFPNPASTQITIDYGNFGLMNGYLVKITNNLGQIVYSANITQQSVTLNLGDWTGDGLYHLKILDPQNNVIENRKIVLQ